MMHSRPMHLGAGAPSPVGFPAAPASQPRVPQPSPSQPNFQPPVPPPQPMVHPAAKKPDAGGFSGALVFIAVAGITMVVVILTGLVVIVGTE